MSKGTATTRDPGGLRRVGTVLFVVLVASVASGSLAPGVARAGRPDGHGWWNRLNDGATAPTAFAPPDVPPDGLYVAGGLPDHQALAAVSVVLDHGEIAQRLRLDPAGSGVRGAVIACAARGTSIIVPTQNGRWSDAPAHDPDRCTDGVVEDGGAVLFDVSAVATPGVASFAVVILAADAGTRAVFSAPAADAVTTTVAPSDDHTAAGPPADAGGVDAPTSSAATPAPFVPPAAGSSPVPAVESQPSPVADAVPQDAAGAGRPAASPLVGALSADSVPGWYGTVGGVIGGALLFGLLLFYSLGYGPLGARYDR